MALNVEILLFRCTAQPNGPQWHYLTTLFVPKANNSPLTHITLTWRGIGAQDTCLLAAHSSQLHLLELSAVLGRTKLSQYAEVTEVSPAWSGPLPIESQARVECSPCGRYLAVTSPHHCCVKLWYRASNTRTGLSFIYLPHSRAVVDMQWREGTRGRAVLLTLSADGCVNLWTESPFTERVNFTLSLVIDEGEGYGVTKHYSATTTFGGIIGVSWVPDPVLPALNHTEQKEDADQRANTHALKQTGHVMTRNIQERQGPTSGVRNSSQDWVLGVQKDGGVLVWKVRGLMEHPQQAPIVLMLSCLKGVLPAQDAWLQLSVSPQLYSFPEPQTYAPNLLNLYTYAPAHYALTAWTISLAATRSHWLINRLVGHTAPVIRVMAHPQLPLVASLDEHHRLVVWKTHDQHVVDVPVLMSNLCCMEQCQTFCWDVQGTVRSVS